MSRKSFAKMELDAGLSFRTVPIEYEGKRAILGNLLDITPRKELEIEILRSNRELVAIDGIMEK